MTLFNRFQRLFFQVLTFILFMPALSSAETYKVGTWKTAQTIQPFFYQDFLPQQDNVKVFSFTNPADQKVALLAGSLDMCGSTLAHAIHSASRGQPVVVVASLCNKCSALVVQKDGPIKAIKDLRGRKIGYVPGTMHEILLRETLSQNDLSPDRDVVLTRVDFFDMGLALARGDIDAFLSGEPFPTLSVAQGYGRILAYPYYGKTIGTINAGMLVTRKAIENNPERVQKLVDAHVQATRYLLAHPDQWLRKAATFGSKLPILEAAAPNMEISWLMDETFVQKARALGERMEALGVITQQPEYDQLFDLRFVKNATAKTAPSRRHE